MNLNTDFTQRVVIRPADTPWVASPLLGVERKMLERAGLEKARATSIVRYAPGASFSEHTHDGGEEYLVLEGEFADENGSYPPGTYVRNPPGSQHAPFSKSGCTIMVKLQQFNAGDTKACVIDTKNAEWRQGLVPGLSVLSLHAHDTEQVALVRWAPSTYFNAHTHWGGEEIYVVEGTFSDEYGDYPQGTWLRSPHLSVHTPFSQQGCTIYVKTGHLG